jgi:glycosyltransferase involved in cell wall biosynthesis
VNSFLEGNKRNILLLITNLGKGGAQRVFFDHASFLSGKHNVEEAVFNINEDERLYNSGLVLHSLDVEAGKNVFGKLKNFLKRSRELKKIIRQNNVDVTISHMDGANWVNVMSRSGEKKILVVHGTVLHDYTVRPVMQFLRKKILIPFFYNRASVTVAVSSGIAEELKRYCGVKKVVTIPNFFDFEEIRNRASEPITPAEESLFSNHDVIITSGRFHEQKKQRYLFPLFKTIKEKNKNAKLVLLGDGSLRNSLIKEAKQNNLSCYTVWDNQPFTEDYDVYFLGYCKNPFQYLKRSAMFVFPSGWEGFPLALCEAMISGVAVLSADCPTGPREILSPGSIDLGYRLNKIERTPFGYLLPMTDKKDFFSCWETAIFELLEDKSRRIRLVEAGQKRIESYDKKSGEEKWLSLIEQLVAEK